MYLSKILITGPACRNPYEIHRSLWKLFPDDAAASRDFLFRLERSDKNHAEVLMQSARKPVNNYQDARILACKDYPISFRMGQRLRFLLVANPVRTIVDEKGRANIKGDPKKCRVPLIRDDEQRSWLSRKLEPSTSLEFLIIEPYFPLYFRKTKEDRAGKIQPVIFQGVLNVKEPDALILLMRQGIGPAKAFGCGLLSLARA